MRDGLPEPVLFEESVAAVILEHAEGSAPLLAYGEMSPVLWLEGNVIAALQLETLSSALQQEKRFSLLCAYPLSETSGGPGKLADLCARHTDVLRLSLAEHRGERRSSGQVQPLRAQATLPTVDMADEKELGLPSGQPAADHPLWRFAMLNKSSIYAVLPAKDIARARDFYREKLGLEQVGENDTEAFFATEQPGAEIRVYQTENAGFAKHTQICWRTDDLDKEMQELRDRGVTFEDYDQPGLKTENGVADYDGERAAWFEDSEGNIHCLSQKV